LQRRAAHLSHHLGVDNQTVCQAIQAVGTRLGWEGRVIREEPCRFSPRPPIQVTNGADLAPMQGQMQGQSEAEDMRGMRSAAWKDLVEHGLLL
jgi:hypothetical protein